MHEFFSLGFSLHNFFFGHFALHEFFFWPVIFSSVLNLDFVMFTGPFCLFCRPFVVIAI